MRELGFAMELLIGRVTPVEAVHPDGILAKHEAFLIHELR